MAAVAGRRYPFCLTGRSVTVADQNKPYSLVVVAPVYDDAAAATQLLTHLERAFSDADVDLRVMLVDDGSPVPLIHQLQAPSGARVEVLRLKRNVGHQRAIALGTAYVHEHVPCDAMLVMDADGEDRPEDAVELVKACRAQTGERIIFAERTRRSESALFQAFYRCYQLLHWVLTGIRVRVGNFSVVPAGRLAALVTLPALWNHFAAAVFHARLPRALVPTIRGRRYTGRSKMNFVALVIHGLQAISVFIEVVTVRLLLTVCLFAGGCAALFAVTLAAKVAPGLAVPVWAPFFFGGMLVAALCLALGSFSITLGLLAQRNNLDFVPIRDYRLFVEGVHNVSRGQDAILTVFRGGDDSRGRQSEHADHGLDAPIRLVPPVAAGDGHAAQQGLPKDSLPAANERSHALTLSRSHAPPPGAPLPAANE